MAYLLISEHVIKTRAWKGLSAWAQPRHTQWCTLFLQRQEPDSTAFISADWLFSASNHFTNGRAWLYSTFLKIKQNPTQTHPFLLKVSPKFSKALKQNQFGFYCSAKMKHFGKTFAHTHTHTPTPFWSTLAVVLQPSAEELSPLLFKTASGTLALVKIILHARSSVRVHPPACLPHQVRVQQVRQHGDTTCGVSSSFPLPTAIPHTELVLPLHSTPWNIMSVHHSAGSAVFLRFKQMSN